ncbi:MAG TPA: GNAT family N-acetyltransferase [Alphaproteobacteria bacterium]|nr:GNAT family N-acetyltransferase [Alphaproteobacteria bacterium]
MTAPARARAAADPALRLAHAETPAAIAACFPVMHELRPHLPGEAEFVAQVERQRSEGYRLLALWRAERCLACAGYRIHENFIHGRHMYVDDLVTAAAERSRGHGDRLLEALAAEAQKRGCRQLVLDSGVDNAAAHRFYFRQRLAITAFHFRRPLA